MKKLIIFLSLFTIGCTNNYTKSIEAYYRQSQGIQLGETKEQVLSKLAETQEILDIADRKSPERFNKDGKLIQIFYFRTHWNDDGLTTDDEFTPYIFEDGILEAIGWHSLGGPKTQGKSKTDIRVDRSYSPYPRRFY